MLTRTKVYTIRIVHGVFIFMTYLMTTLITVLIWYLDSQFNLGVFIHIQNIYRTMMCVALLNQLLLWLYRNKATYGIKYAFLHYLIVLKLRKSLLEGNYFNTRYYFNNEVAILPKIKLTFSKDYKTAILKIENININKDISVVNLSYALSHYVIDRNYLNEDENFQVFEIFDSRATQQYIFNDWGEFFSQSKLRDDYTLMIDRKTDISLFGSLLVGQTGSGKTYALYSLILQMLLKETHYNIYFADPKNSSLAVLGEKVSPNSTATDVEEIIELLRTFNNLMDERKVELKSKLKSKLDATYADFGYEPYIFIFDEFASFQTVLQTMEKKKRDEVMKLLSQVVLQGRQLGFFLWIVMQKSDATLLPTNLRENLPVKFVLGNAESQTYTTAFGSGVEVPDKNFEVGQGVFTCPVIASTPKICHFSYLNFDILRAIEKLVS